MELKICQQLLKGLTCYIPNCNFTINAKNSLDCRLQDWQQKRHGYIYMRLIGLALIEGNLQTHEYRLGIQPNNYKDRVREIEWIKLI